MGCSMKQARAFPPSHVLRAVLTPRYAAGQQAAAQAVLGLGPSPSDAGLPLAAGLLCSHRVASSVTRPVRRTSPRAARTSGKAVQMRGTSLRLAPTLRTGDDAPRLAVGLSPKRSGDHPSCGGAPSHGEELSRRHQPTSSLLLLVCRVSRLSRFRGLSRALGGQRSFSADESVVARRRCQHTPRRFLPWVYPSPSRHIATLPSSTRSPSMRVPSPVPSEPTPSSLARRGADTSPGFDVCTVGKLCEVGIDLASLRGVFDVKERQTLVCRSLEGTQPLGRSVRRQLSYPYFARPVPHRIHQRTFVFAG